MSWLHSLHLVLILTATALMVTAAIHDARSFKIPNWIWLGLVGLFPLFAMTSPREIDWVQHLGVCALVLGVGFALFAGHFAGAGDVKLLAAASLWAGPNYIGVLLVMTGLAGGILAIIYAVMAWQRSRPSSIVADGNADTVMANLAKVAIPYGIAITAGGITVFVMMISPLMF